MGTGNKDPQAPPQATGAIAISTLVAAVLSAISLFGWLLGLRLLTSLGSGLTTMKPNTAVALMLISAAIWLARTPWHRRRYSGWTTLLATLAALIALLTVSEYFLKINIGIDELVFRDVSSGSPFVPRGRPAPATALSLAVMAAAVFLIDRLPKVSQVLALFTCVVALVGLIGYLDHLPTIYSVDRFTSMALNTVIALLALSFALLASRPERGMTGLILHADHSSRSGVLLAGATGLPILLGALTLWGVRLGLYGIEFSFALFSVLLIVLTIVLVWITGRQQAATDEQRTASEAALRDSEERFRAMADNIPNLAWMAHADGHIFWYNSRWYQYTGIPFDKLEGWGWQKVHDPNFVDEVVNRWRTALETSKSFEMEFPLRGNDGVFRWFLTRVSPVMNGEGKVIRWFGTNTNIDDKRRAEEALKQSEELARAVIEGTPASVELLDEAGRTLLINQQGRTFRSQLSNPEATWLQSWTHSDVPSAARAFESAMEGTSTMFTVALNAASSEPTWLEISLTPLRTEGNRRRILSIIRDVTNLRRAEEKLNQTARLESLGVMAGGIAHDFNNLLTGILGNASLLEMSQNAGDAAIAKQIVGAAQRATDLTRQMLAYSGKGRFIIKRINLSAAVVEILQLVRTTIDKKVEIILNLDESLPTIEADPGQMQQLIMNLIINGSDAMEGKVGKVLISTSVVDVDAAFIAHTFRLDEPSLVKGRYVRLEVQDTGCGMSAETISKIFDPFFTTKFAGRGLGLAAVSGILRGHRGALRIHSETGIGTTFKVFLPVAQEQSHNYPPDVPPSLADPGKGEGAVLLVDDEDVIRRVGKMALEKAGYEVLLATNGQQAVELFTANQQRVQLVLLDLTMPIMGGEEALSLIRRVDPKVPIILSSGYNQVATIQESAQQKITGFLQKPYTSKQLCEAAAAALR